MKIEVNVHPGSKQEKVLEVIPGKYEIWTTQPAEKDKANKDVVKQLSFFLNIPKSRIRLTKGKTSRHKLFDIITF